jgi:glycosyltransferase involved in cell wall biosynthesis
MAARNASATIGEAIESVLAQTHEDWELLVVDDASTDSTADVVRGYGDQRIRLLESAPLGVLAQVRNVALAEARGEVVALLDADDLWRPRKLEDQLAVLRERPEVGVVHTGAERLVDGSLEPVPPPPTRPLLPALLERNFVVNSSVALRRELLEQHGAFDPDPELRGSPDYELWLRLAPHTEFAYVPDPLVVYRVHSGQMTSDFAWAAHGTLRALEKHPAGGLDHLRAVGVARSLARVPGRGRAELVRVLLRRPADALAWRFLLRSFVR